MPCEKPELQMTNHPELMAQIGEDFQLLETAISSGILASGHDSEGREAPRYPGSRI